MLEATLNKELKPLLARVGVFHKLHDASTPGIPDWVGEINGGCGAVHIMWIESKIVKGKDIVHVKFRPGQLPFAKKSLSEVFCVSCHPYTGLYFVHLMRVTGELIQNPLPFEEFQAASAKSTPKLRNLVRFLVDWVENA